MDSPLRPTSADRNEGFTAPAVTADLARRQLHVSLAVAGLILAAALAIVGMNGLPATAPAPTVAKLTVQQPQFVRPMTAHAPQGSLPGG